MQHRDVGGYHKGLVQPLAFEMGPWLLPRGCHVRTSGLVAGGLGQGGLSGLLAVVWGHPVAGQGCQDWPREELELMLVIASVLNWVQAGLQGMAPAGR